MEEREIVLKRAKNAVLSRDFSLALRIYNSLLKDDPSNTEYLRSVGSIYEKTGDDQKALEYYARILKVSNTDFNALNSIGGIYRRLKIYDKAIMVLQKALATGQNDAEVNYNLGFTYKLMNENKKAIECFESVIDQNPNDVLAYNHLGSIYYQNKEYNKSIMTYKMGLQIDSNHPILHYNLARSYEAINDQSNAVLSYEASLRGKPGWIDAVRDYSDLLLRQNKSKAALEIVKKSIDLHAGMKEPLYLKGKILFAQNNYLMAEESLEAAASDAIQNYEILSLLAQVYEEEERYFEAEEMITKAESIANENEFNDAEKIAIQILISAKKFEEAWSKLVILNDNQKSPMMLDLEGQFYIASGKTEKLESLEKRIIEMKPNFYRYLTDWGKRFLQIGDIETARKYFILHIEKNKRSIQTWLSLALADEKTGLLEEARTCYEMALKIDSANYLAQEKLNEIGKPLNLRNNSVFENAFEDLSVGNTIRNLKGASDSNIAAGTMQEDSSDLVIESKTTSENENNPPTVEQEETDDEETEEIPEMPDADILEIVTDEIPAEKYDFDGESKSLSQELLEGEELSDFGYEMPPEEEEEKEEEKDDETEGNMVLQNAGDDGNIGTAGNDGNSGNSTNENRDADTTNDESENRASDRTSDDRSPEPEYNAPKQEAYPSESEKELREKLAQAEENAMKAMKAAEKAWDAAQKAADSASAVDNASDYINQMTEDAAKKLQDVTDDLQSKLEEKAETLESQDGSENSLAEETAPEDEEYEGATEGDISESETELDETELDETGSVAPEEEDALCSDDAATSEELAGSDDALSSADAIAPEADEALGSDDALSLPQTEQNLSDLTDLEGTADESSLESGGEISSDNSEEISSEISESEESIEEHQKYQHVINEVSKLLPYIENILENKEDAQRFKHEVSLFNQLKTMGHFLPEAERREFMTSRIRITLDFLIAKLSGKPGLLKTSNSLRKSGFFEKQDESISEITEEIQNLSKPELIKKVIGDMKLLTENLDDKELAEGLRKIAAETEDKLK